MLKTPDCLIVPLRFPVTFAVEVVDRCSVYAGDTRKGHFFPTPGFKDHVGSLKFAVVEAFIYTTNTGRWYNSGFDFVFCCLSRLKTVMEKVDIANDFFKFNSLF